VAKALNPLGVSDAEPTADPTTPPEART
jgi:hypothetical protein